ncbi:hypothetical protein [Tsukamurella paurometabola]|uniref:Uncharacterized protein n=1 Tax=Tsukamurella paurometabola TaxID=2061 RepID=A0A3P8JVS8_TSUPA|nr:hypothetical protein [Tsukamurella paurometabola]UEA84391.1 hypothetical protein LK411_06095 [Tsukamurella paurometabola]VDR36954.1 Uncharacterised protein [Tsukamurella paurometabola]
MNTDLIVGLGGGGVIGTVLAAIVSAVAGRGKSRAEAAKFLTDAAAELTNIGASLTANVNTQLIAVRAELKSLAEAVDHLTERVDDVVPLIEADHPQTAAALRDANAAVKRAL